MDQQAMLVWRDLGHTGMVTFEVKTVRRDDTVQILQRRHAEGFGVGGARLSNAPNDVLLEFRRQPVGWR
jgi:hypothetical protein